MGEDMNFALLLVTPIRQQAELVSNYDIDTGCQINYPVTEVLSMVVISSTRKSDADSKPDTKLTNHR